MSSRQPPSRPGSSRREQEYRREQNYRREQDSRRGQDFDSRRDSASRSQRSGTSPRKHEQDRSLGSSRPRSSSHGRPSGRAPAKRPVQRRKKRFPILPLVFLLALLVIIVLVFRSCSGSKEPADSFSLTVSPAQTLIVDDTGEIAIEGLPEDFSGKINWTSSDPGIVEVVQGQTKAQATIKALAPGSALVAAIVNGKSISKTVNVEAIPENIDAITLNYATASILSGKTLQLEAVITLDDNTEPPELPIDWSSNTVSVARVDRYGLVTARDVGTAAITAKVGNQTAVCMVTVQKNPDGEPVGSTEGYGSDDPADQTDPDNAPTAGTPPAVPETPADSDKPASPPPPVKDPNNNAPHTDNDTHSNNDGNSNANEATSLALSQSIAYLETGQTMTLGVLVTPSGAPVSWSSSNPSVASIADTGVVTALSPGTAIITASSGGFSSNCSVEVNASGDPPQEGEPSVPDSGHV